MPGGRPRKPRHLKALAGTLRSDREPEHPVELEPGVPPMPDYLDDYARECWEFYAGRLSAINVLTEHDWAQLVRLCQAWSRIRQCEAIIAEKGFTFTTAKGYEQQVPEVGILHTAEDKFHKLAGRFGLDPSSRDGISKVKPSTSGNSFAGLVG